MYTEYRAHYVRAVFNIFGVGVPASAVTADSARGHWLVSLGAFHFFVVSVRQRKLTTARCLLWFLLMLAGEMAGGQPWVY